MIISREDLSVITLKSSFVYEYGDLPHFMQCINSFPLRFFVRYRSSKVDPSQHRWSRLLKVVQREFGGSRDTANSGFADKDRDVGSTTGGGGSPTSVVPIQWREKKFIIMLSVEGEEKYVELPRLSLHLPSEDEIMDYCARRAELRPDDVVGRDADVSPIARDQLPTPREIQKLRDFRRNVIENHRWTPEELAVAREQNELMGRVGAGCAPVRLTVNSMNNMLFESQLSIASSRRSVGHLAAAMERRNAVRLPGSTSSQPSSLTPTPTAPLPTATFPETQRSGGSGSGMGDTSAEVLTQAGEERMSAVDPQLLQEMLRVWNESMRHEEQFYKYVSSKDRSAYLTKIATITQNNYDRNRQDRVRGIENEKRLDRKANLVESEGLWIVDDALRAKLAESYRKEQDGEIGAGNAETVADGKKCDKPNSSGSGSSHPHVDKEEAMLQRFMKFHREQELSFASVPEDFLDQVTDVNLSLPSACGDDTRSVDVADVSSHGSASVGQRAELLLLSSKPEAVTSQLFHRVACMNGRTSHKRVRSASSKS